MAVAGALSALSALSALIPVSRACRLLDQRAEAKRIASLRSLLIELGLHREVTVERQRGAVPLHQPLDLQHPPGVTTRIVVGEDTPTPAETR